MAQLGTSGEGDGMGSAESSRAGQEFASDYPLGQYHYPTLQHVLLGSTLYHAQDMLLSMTLGTIYGPFDRVFTMLTIEGELKRQGILRSPQGFGGVRACWVRLWEREGIRGCMRTSVLTPLLRFPTRLLGDLFSTVMCHYCYNWFHVQPFVVMVVAMIASVCVTAPYNILQRFLRNMYRGDLKTVVQAPEGGAGKGKAEHSTTTTWGRIWRGRSDVRYHFRNVFHAGRQLYHQLHWRLVTSTVLLEILYKTLFMWFFPVLLDTIPVVKGSFWGRGMTLYLRDLLMQPFRVVMGRVAVSAGFRLQDSEPAPEELEVLEGTPGGQVRSPPPHMYTSLWDCVKTIYVEDGVTGIWAGLRYRCLLSTLAWLSVLIAPPAAEG